jgi:hypothetical protein
MARRMWPTRSRPPHCPTMRSSLRPSRPRSMPHLPVFPQVVGRRVCAADRPSAGVTVSETAALLALATAAELFVGGDAHALPHSYEASREIRDLHFHFKDCNRKATKRIVPAVASGTPIAMGETATAPQPDAYDVNQNTGRQDLLTHRFASCHPALGRRDRRHTRTSGPIRWRWTLARSSTNFI